VLYKRGENTDAIGALQKAVDKSLHLAVLRYHLAMAQLISRSNTTTFVPLASRGRYLPRTPEEKSYSGLISSLSAFFIDRSFFAGRPPCIDNSYSGTGEWEPHLMIALRG